MNSKLVALLCLLAGTLAGFKIGRSTTPAPELTPARSRSSLEPLPPADPPGDHAVKIGSSSEPDSAATLSLEDKAAEIRNQFTGGFNARHLSRLRELIYTTPPSDYSALVAALREDVKTTEGYALIRELMPRWGEHDPLAAVAFAQTFSDRSRRTHALSMALSGWAVSDLDGAKAYVIGLKGDAEIDRLATGVVTEMARRSPQDAFAFADSLGLLQGRNYSAVAGIFHIWAMDDPLAASREMMNLKSPRQRSLIMPTVLGTIAHKNPQTAWDITLTVKAADKRQTLQRSILARVVQNNPQAAIRLADDLNPSERIKGYSDIARNWAQRDLGSALKWAAELPGGRTREQVFRSLGHKWASEDPHAMAEYVGQLPPGEQRYELSGSLVSRWSNDDPTAALAWSDALPPGNSRNNATRHAISALAKNDPQAAAKWVDEQPANSHRNNLYGMIAGSWVRSNPEEAMAWAQTLPPSGLEAAARNLIHHAAASAPVAAAEFVDSISKNAAIHLTGTVVQNWVEIDADAAAAWAGKFEDGMAKDNAFSALGDTWGRTDPAAAAAFALDEENERLRDKLITKVASKWGASDPGQAIKWINTLAEGDAHRQAVVGVVTGISRYAPDKAAEYVANLTAGETQEKAAQAVVSRWSQLNVNDAADWVAKFPEGKARTSALRTVVQNWAHSDMEG